jgi:hypothetical protein
VNPLDDTLVDETQIPSSTFKFYSLRSTMLVRRLTARDGPVEACIEFDPLASENGIDHQVGATPEEVMQAIWVAAEMGAGGAYAHWTLAVAAVDG